ncbi:MAG: M1 family metallopeptidase [Deltaproteobacteria bacterium]|nr:M1 family metallopeptidase [Deltaproteobacteria bacterium]
MTKRWTPLLVLALACGGTPEGQRPTTVAPAEPTDEGPILVAEGEAPTGQLPEGVSPQGYFLALTADPSQDSFSGTTDIRVRLDAAQQHIWLHGKDLQVSSVTITPEGGEPITGAFEQVDEEGTAIVRFEAPVDAGLADLHFEYTAPFNRALHGLYKVTEGEHDYAFTQFEATSARLVFPGFDEPRFKTPFSASLTVRKDDEAIFSTPATGTEEAGEMKTVTFAASRPIPTYLLAIAIGPLDVVEHEALPANDVRPESLPFRGVAARGKGERLAYALEHTGAILTALESYFGIPFPYQKLDIVAVPDFGAGAMENVGLITFRETLLLLDENAPEGQKRAYAYVMAHELAHQWFGNLVTLAWWDDLWLNEAFATWMGFKATAAVYPDYHADLTLLQSVHSAMHTDSMVTARQIRQPIESNHDIRNAFDSITYRKGGGVLAMFEAWLGEETFRNGVRAYLNANADGTATYEDLLGMLDQAADDKEVAGPFSTFLLQPGLPFLSFAVDCDGDTPTVGITQQRYLPVGSTGSTAQTWQLPVCARYGTAGGDDNLACTLVREQEATLPLEACPAWLMPNAGGSGYFRFAMDEADLEKLRDAGWSHLTDAEKVAFSDSLVGAFQNGSLAAAGFYSAMQPLARSEIRPVATAPIGSLYFAVEDLVPAENQPAVRAYAKRLYTPAYRRLRFRPRGNEDGERALLRASVVDALATIGEDRGVRREAKRAAERYLGYGARGDGEVHPDAIDSNLVGVSLAIAIQDGDAGFFDHVLNLFANADDALLRARLLSAMAHTKDPELAARVRALALDERLRLNEVTTPLRVQMGMPETREPTWLWAKEHFEELRTRLEDGAGRLPRLGSAFCSAEKADEVEAFFRQRAEALPGGPRTLANTLEQIRLCAARVETHRQSAVDFFD